ncbi:MAG: DUF4430 domain-containing protein [Clostridia bacterium]|nr:DUF4430 domain-containing protein [Clostridia bacterium]
MKKTNFTKVLSLLLCFVLIAVTALLATGCGADKNQTPSDPSTADTSSVVLGEGEKTFAFAVTHLDGTKATFDIRTDKATVGEALSELGLIDGEQGDYGLYVKTVDNETVDYDKDGKYWAFYVNGEMAMQGVDSTEIEIDAVYEFKAE